MIGEPLPCPFCGGSAIAVDELRPGHAAGDPGARAYFYACASCAATGGWAKSTSAALRLWNLRTSPKVPA